MRMTATDPSHSALIRAVERVDRTTPIEETGNPHSVGALTVKIMTRDRNQIPIPAAYRKRTKAQSGYRHWQDVQVQLVRQSRSD